MATTGVAVAALATGDVAFSIDEITELEANDLVTHGGDFTDKLVADYHGRLNSRLGPFIPFVDVHIGAANGSAFHANEHVAGPGPWHRCFNEVKAGSRGLLGQSAHRGGDHGREGKSKPDWLF